MRCKSSRGLDVSKGQNLRFIQQEREETQAARAANESF